MIYRFRVILDNDTKDDIFRDLEITKDSTLKDLNDLILLSFKFNGIEMSSFFTVDDEGTKLTKLVSSALMIQLKQWILVVLSDLLNEVIKNFYTYMIL